MPGKSGDSVKPDEVEKLIMHESCSISGCFEVSLIWN